MFCYVILHYQVEEETISCVKKLKQIKGNHRIIIIDNCSPNGSGKRLQDKYRDDLIVDVILHSKNDGFAKGNNIGCNFAKNHYNPDFYVVMNNDIEITQEDFETRIERIYQQEHFDILGPDIYSTSYKLHQSPKSTKRTTIEDAKRLRASYQKKVNSKLIVPIRCYLKKVPFLKKAKNVATRNLSGINYQEKYYNIPLHGSCVVFSKAFMSKREKAFFSGTFFYYEMEILDYEAQELGLKEIYDPSIRVLHHQNVSTNATYKNELEKTQFMNEQNLKSINAFLKEYDNR